MSSTIAAPVQQQPHQQQQESPQQQQQQQSSAAAAAIKRKRSNSIVDNIVKGISDEHAAKRGSSQVLDSAIDHNLINHPIQPTPSQSSTGLASVSASAPAAANAPTAQPQPHLPHHHIDQIPSMSLPHATATVAASSAAQDGLDGLSGGQKPPVGSEEWHRMRRDNHKEVERRRRETINEGITELAKIVPGCEKNKGSILQRAVQYIQQLKENEAANIEKWTLEKLLTEQAIAELSASNEKLKAEVDRAWREADAWKKTCAHAGIKNKQDE
ncbi:hypothetical protein V1525DRAFT_403145 [Lipomyces kononenkoae]|uniref:Uncharacterized protein n=1 Tax=Lipomyces kononenkoae TaxID=34357 RepID=A0ACC3T1X5_LIPKO